MENMMSKLRNLDAYPKINEDFYSRTLSGGVITLASSIVMLFLFLSELRTRIYSLSYFVEIEMQSGVDPGQDLRSAYEISLIHHSDIRCHFRSIRALMRFR
ncbi:PREDICTED: endoplasmic [Prunus dulcis]|nr:PREDICTED: endoplasmic [Prunus dulcis]